MTQPQDMQELIRQAAEVQAALQQAQMELLQTEVTGTAGGELVTDEFAPAWWVLSDADGNLACVCTWQARG